MSAFRVLDESKTMREILIPGTGWDTESIVNGFIKVPSLEAANRNMKVIGKFDFDDVYPFTDIFLGISAAAYCFYVIGFAGSYKQIEEDWNEWLWKFGQLLSHLEAVEARVSLSCLLGDYIWKLEPKSLFEDPYAKESTQGQMWGITESPQPDFSTDSTWLTHCAALNSDCWPPLIERWSIH